MDKTPFSKKVEILGDFYADVCEDESIMSSQLMQDHRDTLFICLSANVKWVTVEQGFEFFIEDAWVDFCNSIHVDHHGEYANYISLMEFANE